MPFPGQEDAKVSESELADLAKRLTAGFSPEKLYACLTALQSIHTCSEQVNFPCRVYRRDIPDIELLPPSYDWEFTRRHPYYVQYQPLAALYSGFAGVGAQGVVQSDLWGKAEKAAAILRALGCLGPYMHPSHDARQLRWLRANHLPFSNQQAHPVSYIYLAARLLVDLPKEARQQVGRILAGEPWETKGGRPIGDNLAAGLAALQAIRDPVVDCPLPDLLFISPEASEKGVADTVRLVLAHSKSQTDAPVKRRHSELQLDEYLQVWDLREGWANGQYDWKVTKRFRDIAIETGTPEGSVKNRYRAAFRYITGHEYTPDLFAVLFGPLACHQSKWAGWRKSKQRGAEVGSPKLVATSAKAVDEEGRNASVLDQQTATSFDPIAMIELKTDILELVRRGRSAEQIAAELEIAHGDVAKLIEFFTSHDSESLSS
jgi:hypothetical protein